MVEVAKYGMQKELLKKVHKIGLEMILSGITYLWFSFLYIPKYSILNFDATYSALGLVVLFSLLGVYAIVHLIR